MYLQGVLLKNRSSWMDSKVKSGEKSLRNTHTCTGDVFLDRRISSPRTYETVVLMVRNCRLKSASVVIVAVLAHQPVISHKIFTV